MNIWFRSLQQEKLSKEISVSSNLVNKRDFLGEGNKRSNTLAVNLVVFSEARTSIVLESIKKKWSDCVPNVKKSFLRMFSLCQGNGDNNFISFCFNIEKHILKILHVQNLELFEGVTRWKIEGLPIQQSEKKLMVKIREAVFSLQFVWLGNECGLKVNFGIPCQSLPYSLPSLL